jgi:alanine racemase
MACSLVSVFLGFCGFKTKLLQCKDIFFILPEPNLMNYTIKNLAEIVSGTIIKQANLDCVINHLLIDSRKILYAETSLFFAIKGQRNDGHAYLSKVYKQGVRSFFVEYTNEVCLSWKDANIILVNDCVLALQQVAAAHREKFNCKVVGITGSNGKTVVKEWLNQLLNQQLKIVKSPKSFNSQVGVPLSVWQLGAVHELALFEAGISEPNEMHKLQTVIKPNLGILTYLGNAHDEGFESKQQKLIEKLQLFKSVQTLFYCIDQPLVAQEVNLFLQENTTVHGISWSAKNNPDATHQFNTLPMVNETKITFNGREVIIPFTDEASVWNACTCLAFVIYCCNNLNLNSASVFENFSKLEPVEMRMQLKEGINNCMIINDSYSADINALQIALDFFEQQGKGLKKTVILSDFFQSGMLNDELYQHVGNLINQKLVDKFIGIGSDVLKLKPVLHMPEQYYFNSTQDFIKSFHQLDFTHEIILLKGARAFEFEKINALLERKVHETIFEINLNALVQNLNVYKKHINPGTKIMAMVKAFSYGAGSYEIAKVLEFNNIDYLAVAYADEGVVLREAGISTPIMVMNPEPSGFEAMFKYNLEPEVYSFEMLHALIIAANGLEIGVHIELDSGMKRLGFDANELEPLIALLKIHPNLQVKSVFTHLAASDEHEHDDFTQQQIFIFKNMADKLCSAFEYSIIKHCLNSSGIVRFKHAQFNMVRLGIGLYGIDPTLLVQNQLQQIGTLKTVISQIRQLEAGESVGYGRKGKVNKPSKIAVTAIGYADGLNRLLSNGNGYMLVNGKQAPVIGNICMDMTMIDVTEINCKVGDEVIVFGNELPVTLMAKKLNTIPYEILTSISQRVKRVYYYE